MGKQVPSSALLDADDDPENLSKLLSPTDLRGFTPLHLAAFAGHLDCIQSLVQCRAYHQLSVSRLAPVNALLTHLILWMSCFTRLHPDAARQIH